MTTQRNSSWALSDKSPWPRGAPFATIDLGPLRASEALSLAGGFIDTSQRLALACIERAAGNPLFLEQLLRNAEEGSEDVVPASIQSLVLARMDRLAARDRLAFQTAAVIGQDSIWTCCVGPFIFSIV